MGLTTTRELRWDAPGAPALTGQVGSFYNLIKTFLVSCGWSIEWDEPANYKVVLRNSLAHGGSGCYLRVLDDGSHPTRGSRLARTWIYEEMTDIDTGTGGAQHPTAASPAGEIGKSITSDATPRAYALWADELTLHGNIFTHNLVNINTYLGEHVAFSCGDYIKAIPGDVSVYAAWPRYYYGDFHQSNILKLGPELYTIAPNTRFFVSRDKTGIVTPVDAGPVCSPNLSSTQLNVAIGGSAARGTYPAGGHISGAWSIPAIIGEFNGTTIRGMLRGIRYPLNRVEDVHAFANWQPISALGDPRGSTYVVMRGTADAASAPFTGAVLIDKTGPW